MSLVIPSAVRSHSFVDSHNIDGVLAQVIGRRPKPEERPRWNRVKEYLTRHLGVTDKPCFVVDRGRFTDGFFPLYRALKGMGFDVPVVDKIGDHVGNDDPVDEFILDQLQVILQLVRDGEKHPIVLLSHDHIYAPSLQGILNAGGRVFIMGFREWLHPNLLRLEKAGAETVDLEHHVGAFLHRLPRPYCPIEFDC
jgi:uncharacterized protein